MVWYLSLVASLRNSQRRIIHIDNSIQEYGREREEKKHTHTHTHTQNLIAFRLTRPNSAKSGKFFVLLFSCVKHITHTQHIHTHIHTQSIFKSRTSSNLSGPTHKKVFFCVQHWERRTEQKEPRVEQINSEKCRNSTKSNQRDTNSFFRTRIFCVSNNRKRKEIVFLRVSEIDWNW